MMITVTKEGNTCLGDHLMAAFLVRVLLDNNIKAQFGCNLYRHLLEGIPFGRNLTVLDFDYDQGKIPLMQTSINRFKNHFPNLSNKSIEIKTPYVPIKFTHDPNSIPMDVVLVTTSGPWSKIRNWPYFDTLKKTLTEEGITWVDLNSFGFNWANSKTSLITVMNLIYKCKVFVSLDTGASHFATGILSKKTTKNNFIIQSGFTSFQYWASHYGDLFTPIELNVACQGCLYREIQQCPHGHMCMTQISKEAVMEYVRRGLKA